LSAPASLATVPVLTEETAKVIRAYLASQWKENPQGLLFPNRKGRPWKRAHVVKFGLWPILKKLGIPTHNAGLHAFRHGLGTALANAGASPAVVQRTSRHTDIKTTLRFYVHADADVQRAALSQLQSLQMERLLQTSAVSCVLSESFGRGGGDRTKSSVEKT
jgi:integrase